MRPVQMKRKGLSPLNVRRLNNFKANRRGWWSLWIFLALFLLTLFAELIANERPLIVSYKGELLFPVLVDYPEEKFGGFYAVTRYYDPFIREEIEANGWMLHRADPLRSHHALLCLAVALPHRADLDAGPRRKPAPICPTAPRMPIAGRAAGTGWAPTIRAAMCWPGSSTASACRCSSA
jgi:hypothetical protein